MSYYELSDTISQSIKEQFPSVYNEEGELLVSLVEAYYEYLENTEKFHIFESRKMFEYSDIDDTVSEFMSHFKKKYLEGLPYITSTDKKFIIKHIMDLYRTKGSEKSLKLLMRILFDEDATVYYPKKDILKVSDSKWKVPEYIELSSGFDVSGLVGKKIFGSSSGAKAFVESIIKKRVNGTIIYIAHLSSIEGSFIKDELVTSDGSITHSPKVIGSLNSINIENGGRNFQVGDILTVESEFGVQGKVKVSEVEEATGRVDFEIVDGGYGYTNTTSGTTQNDILISDAILYVDTANLETEFIKNEVVEQRIEKIYTLSASDVNGANTGEYITGVDSNGVEVANGVIISIANTDADGLVTSSASANSVITVQIVDEGSFGSQRKITTDTGASFADGEVLEEESTYTLSISSTVGTFQIGEVIEQFVREEVSNTIISYAHGICDSANSSTIEVSKAWGPFIVGSKILGVTSGAEASLDDQNTDVTGARASISAVSNNEVFVYDIVGEFTSNNLVKGLKTKLTDTIISVTDSGATDVWLNGSNTSNGVIDSTEKAYANGIVVGSNTTAVGIYGNTSPFYFEDGLDLYIDTKRTQMFSPPRDSNNDIVELSVAIEGIATGEGATFKVGYLEDTETVSLNTDLIGGNNINDIPWREVLLSGKNSGTGFVDSITVVDGGTGYSNGTVVAINNGGYAGGDPYLSANATITTDGAGVITAVTVVDPGEGYYEDPIVDMSLYTAGTEANVSINMEYGYGFINLPTANSNTIIGDALNTEEFTIGTIASIAGINPGSNYNASPFVSVNNSYISSYGRRDLIVELSSISGTFTVGEKLIQDIGGTVTEKGEITKYVTDGAGNGLVYIKRKAFNISFNDAEPVIGQTTNTSGTIEKVYNDVTSEVIGKNAEITATAIAASGIVKKVEVIDSGYGYFNGTDSTLTSSNSVFVVDGSVISTSSGISEGYWETTNSHLNSEKKIQDSSYYQNYSYEIRSGLSFDRYEKILTDLMHVSGMKMYGAVLRISTIDSQINIVDSVITQE